MNSILNLLPHSVREKMRKDGNAILWALLGGLGLMGTLVTLVFLLIEVFGQTPRGVTIAAWALAVATGAACLVGFLVWGTGSEDKRREQGPFELIPIWFWLIIVALGIACGVFAGLASRP